MEKDIKNFFRSIPAASREHRKAAYEHLIGVENGSIPSRTAKMPWMLPAWENGLKILNEVIEESNQSNNTTMKKLIISLLVVLIGFAAQAQNYIINGTMEPGLNNDSLASPWYIGLDNDSRIENGLQFVTSPFTSILGQRLNIENPIGRTFRLQFDINSNTWTQVVIWIDSVNSYVQSNPNPMPTGSCHYDYNFTYTQLTIYAIDFICLPTGNTWLMLDNVSLTEVFPVGIDEHLLINSIAKYYDMMGNPLYGIPEQGMYIELKNGVARKFNRIKN